MATPTVTPIPVGYSRRNPAGLDAPLFFRKESLGKTYEVRITLRQTVRGEEAWQRVKAANMFNDAPKEGQEYLLALVRFEYLKGPTEDTTYDLSSYEFTAVSSEAKEYDNPFCVEPDPKFGGGLYSGASHEGWICLQVATWDAQPVITYGRNYDGTGGVWWRLAW
jgi:hypothetical protein